eukprot:jgi/Botrbrau1/11904/Bobra.0171s0014.1
MMLVPMGPYREWLSQPVQGPLMMLVPMGPYREWLSQPTQGPLLMLVPMGPWYPHRERLSQPTQGSLLMLVPLDPWYPHPWASSLHPKGYSPHPTGCCEGSSSHLQALVHASQTSHVPSLTPTRLTCASVTVSHPSCRQLCVLFNPPNQP